MTKPTMLIINLPFAGFYESKYSGELDNIEERDAEWREEEERDKFAPELRLTASDYAEIYFRHTDYRAAYHHIAREFVASFDMVASEELGAPLRLQFETLSSPREYNFATDRIFAYIPLAVVRRLFTISKAEKHVRLAATIKARFTSYDGFLSGYRNDLDTWLAKRLPDWDHNELGTLLTALLGDCDALDWRVWEHMTESNDFDTARDNAVDWAKVDADIAELRQEKENELRVEDPNYVVPPVRCSETVDMFTGRTG